MGRVPRGSVQPCHMPYWNTVPNDITAMHKCIVSLTTRQVVQPPEAFTYMLQQHTLLTFPSST